jgi:hypothetical protein
LRQQRAFDRFQGWQKSQIYSGFGRQIADGRPRLLSLFTEDSAQWIGFSRQTVRIAGPGKIIQSLVEREKAYLKLQNRNQLLIRASEALGLNASRMKLPDDQAVST